MRFVIACSVAVMAVACGQTLDNPSSPTSLGDTPSVSGGERVSLRQAGIQCSDAPVVWVTKNFSPVGRSIHVVWLPAPNVETYQVEVLHNRNGETPKFVYSFFTNRTEASIDDREDGGRYYVRVRVKNPCDVFGAWSTTLIIYMDGGSDKGGQDTPTEPPYEPPGDDDEGGGDDDCEEDDNDGNGNDCDHDDDGNPGNS